MEKQDILEKSRREKTDEGVTYAENAGRTRGSPTRKTRGGGMG